jgi:demethylspheroidene O-methyltransferase
LCAGFVYSQVLFACVRLRLMEALADGPRPVAEIATQVQLEPDAARCLLDAAVALGLLEQRGEDHYGLGELGAAMLGNPGVAAMVEHHELLYADLADPVAMLRGARGQQRLAAYWPYATAARPQALTGGQVAAYTDLMSASQPLVAADVLAAYDFAAHRCLLDVGGGDGTFLAAVAERAPHLQLQLFDLPAVVERAREKLATRGLAARVQCTGGNFAADALPRGADVASLVRILHDHDDPQVMRILRAVREALGPGGVLVIGEPLAQAAGDGSMRDAYFGFYLRAMGSGRPRSARQLGAMLAAAGYTDIREIETARPLLTGVVTARIRPDAQL